MQRAVCTACRVRRLIRGGQIIDGSSNPWFHGDLAIRGDRIAAVGKLGNAGGRRVIDAAGLAVAPGFIDLHTHSDMTLLADGTAQSKVRQGVTVEVLGEGGSVAPRDGLTDVSEDGQTPDWTTFTSYFERVRRQGISINVASYVAADQVRRVVLFRQTTCCTGECFRRAPRSSCRMRCG